MVPSYTLENISFHVWTYWACSARWYHVLPVQTILRGTHFTSCFVMQTQAEQSGWNWQYLSVWYIHCQFLLFASSRALLKIIINGSFIIKVAPWGKAHFWFKYEEQAQLSHSGETVAQLTDWIQFTVTFSPHYTLWLVHIGWCTVDLSQMLHNIFQWCFS